MLMILFFYSCGNQDSFQHEDQGLNTKVNQLDNVPNNASLDSVKRQVFVDSALYYLLDLGDHEMSRIMFDSARMAGMSRHNYDYSIGYTFYIENEYLRAMFLFERALDEEPNNPKYALRLAECYYFLNKEKNLIIETLKQGLLNGGKYPENIPTTFVKGTELEDLINKNLDSVH